MNNPIIFQEMGSEGASESGWKTVYNKDSSEGVQRNDVLPEKEHEGIKLRPRVVTKPKRLVNQMPGNIGRPEREITEYTMRNRPERAPVLFEPSSPSTKEFYYAPNDLTSKRVKADQLNLPHEWPEESQTNYGDSDLNLEVGPDGYHNMEQDSNFSRKPKTWRFRTRDNDLGLTQVRDKPLPDLRDVGIGEMIYPMTGGLRPIVFGATPGQRKQKKKLNKKRRPEKPKAEPKAEEPTKAEPPKAQPEAAKPAGASFTMDVEGADEATGNGVVVVKDTETGKVVLRYGMMDGQPVMEPTYDESADGKQWTEAMATVLRNLADMLPESVATNSNLPTPPAEVTDKLNLRSRPAPPKVPKSGYRGNILEDPALEGLNMLDQEKLFTTIRKWEDDTYVMTGDRLDAGTKEVLAEKPEGAGQYFSWLYISPEESKKNAAKDVEKEGFTISPGEGVLSVERLDGWKQAETEVMKRRRARPA